MHDPRLQKLADVLVNYSTAVQPGDWVHIDAGYIALPLVKEIVAYVIKAGGHPTTKLMSSDLMATELALANPEQLAWISPLDMLMIKEVDVSIYIRATNNTRALSSVSPERMQKSQAAYTEWFDISMKRSAANELRWTMTNYPCPALAQEADMSLSQYADFIFKAMFIDQDDPVACWQKMHADQARLVDWLAGRKQVAILGPHVDLTLSIEGRSFVNAQGKENMPDGEIFTGPVEDSAEGWVEFTYPAIMAGREVQGVRLEFEQGKVVGASAEKNEEYLLSMLDTDDGARYLGELGIGTNYGITRFTKDLLFDEKIGGTFHLAVGAGYPETGSVNKSAIHWDMICDAHEETEIRVDGELFYKDGQFVV